MRNSLRTTLVAVVLLAGAVIAEAQQTKRISRIGYLSGTDPATDALRIEGIRQRLREHGYIEEQNIVIEYRHAEGKLDRLPELAAELVRLKVDIIMVAGGDLPIRATMNATKTIPIVMTGGGVDPVRAGFVKSLAHPGGNVTGITSLTVDLAAKRVDVLKEAVGKLTRLAVLYDPASASPAIELKEVLLAAAPVLKLTVSYWEVPDAEALDKVFVAMDRQRPDGLYVPTGGQMRGYLKRIVGFTVKSRLPSMHAYREAVDAGGLMYYGADVADSYRQVAWYVDRILKGSKPEDLPVQQPMRFEFVVNLQTAKKIGVNINTDVLARATKIIR